VASERIHQRIIAIPAVAGPEDILDQRLQPAVPKARVDIRDELFLFPRPDVEEFRACPGLLKWRQVLVYVGLRGIVEYDHLD
jgi:hypothetical protein